MRYKNGELLYVYRRYTDSENGVLVFFRGEHKGDVDLSYHGSPHYENFIVCEYLDSHDRVEFGDQTYCWRPVDEYIKDMQNKLKEIQRLSIV